MEEDCVMLGDDGQVFYKYNLEHLAIQGLGT